LIKSHNKLLATILLFAVIAGGWVYFYFFLDWVTYPSYYDKTVENSPEERCYSPNFQYYIIRKQTPFDYHFSMDNVSGTSTLYDASGKKLYSAKADLDEDNGPIWARSSVYYLGANDWSYRLPTKPGRGDGCFSPIRRLWKATKDTSVYSSDHETENKILYELKKGTECIYYGSSKQMRTYYFLVCDETGTIVADKENFEERTIDLRTQEMQAPSKRD